MSCARGNGLSGGLRESATFDRKVVGRQHGLCRYEHPPAFRSAAKLADMTDM